MGFPEDDGSGNAGQGYESFNGPEVNVNISDLASYYFAMNDIQMAAMGPATMELSPMPQMIREGLSTPGDSGAGVLAEGVYAAHLLAQRHSEFQQFLGDVLEGIRNIGSAAAVVAEVYEHGDWRSATSLADISFAFSDPTAQPPKGFRKVESWSDYEQRMAAQRGDLAMSASGDDHLARPIYPANGVTLYLFPDGSSKQVTVTTVAATSPYQSSAQVTTTTIYGPGAKLISTTTRETYGVYGGASVDKTITDHGDERNGSSSTTSTVTDSDGKVTVTNQTTTRTDGEVKTGEPSAPVTIDPGDHGGESAGAGPVEQAENQLDTYGEDWYVKQFGRGY